MRADVYRKAAELVASGQVPYACFAIRGAISGIGAKTMREWDAVIRERNRAVRLFAKYFKPRGAAECLPWFGCWGDPENQKHRITALLLMAAIVEGGDA